MRGIRSWRRPELLVRLGRGGRDERVPALVNPTPHTLHPEL